MGVDGSASLKNLRQVLALGIVACLFQPAFAEARGAAASSATGRAYAASQASAATHVYAAIPRDVGSIEGGGTARPVAAWTQFCSRYPGECEVDTREARTVPLTSKLWRTLNRVNREVNAAIKPRTDLEHWGIVDRWDMAEDGSGDCEDYQLMKRSILAARHGLPRRAMRMTVVIDEQGEGHAVLTIRTDDGDIVLDNKRNAVLTWSDTGYVFVKREGQDEPGWVSLGDRAAPVTTANR